MCSSDLAAEGGAFGSTAVRVPGFVAGRGVTGAFTLPSASGGVVAAGVESHPATRRTPTAAATAAATAPGRNILRQMGLWAMGWSGYDACSLKDSRRD